MASETGPGAASRYRTQNPPSAASIAARSSVQRGTGSRGAPGASAASAAASRLLVEVIEREGPIALLDKKLDLRLDPGQLARRSAQPLDSLLKEGERAIEGQ